MGGLHQAHTIYTHPECVVVSVHPECVVVSVRKNTAGLWPLHMQPLKPRKPHLIPSSHL